MIAEKTYGLLNTDSRLMIAIAYLAWNERWHVKLNYSDSERYESVKPRIGIVH